MTVDDDLAALGLVELVARMHAGPADPAARCEELVALLDGVDVGRVALQLAVMVEAVAATSGFPLGALLALTRRDLLQA